MRITHILITLTPLIKKDYIYQFIMIEYLSWQITYRTVVFLDSKRRLNFELLTEIYESLFYCLFVCVNEQSVFWTEVLYI